MNLVKVKDSDLRAAASEEADDFLKLFTDAIMTAIGGEVTSKSMSELNGDQLTLLAYSFLHEEVMDGGFVQLIHNGYGGFIFYNPFAKAVKGWGLDKLATLVNRGNRLFRKYRREIEIDCDDDEFMELFERFPMFDDLDDIFVENEEEWTQIIAQYVKEHIDSFAEIVE